MSLFSKNHMKVRSEKTLKIPFELGRFIFGILLGEGMRCSYLITFYNNSVKITEFCLCVDLAFIQLLDRLMMVTFVLYLFLME